MNPAPLLGGATVKWGACVLSDIKPLSGFPPEMHYDLMSALAAVCDFTRVCFFLTSLPPGEHSDLLLLLRLLPAGDPLSSLQGGSAWQYVETRALV